jgi:hypothetical protein
LADLERAQLLDLQRQVAAPASSASASEPVQALQERVAAISAQLQHLQTPQQPPPLSSPASPQLLIAPATIAELGAALGNAVTQAVSLIANA